MENDMMMDEYAYVCTFCSTNIAAASDLLYTFDYSRTRAGTVGIFKDNLDKLMIWNGFELVQAIGHEENIKVTIPCQVCRNDHKKCSYDCVFARYFPKGDESKILISNMSQLFGVSKVGALLNKYKLPLRDSIVRSILFESEGRITNPSRICRLISHLQSEILKTTADLHSTKAQLQPYQVATKQGQLPSSTSRGKQIPSFDSSNVYYVCRICGNSALLRDYDQIDETAPKTGPAPRGTAPARQQQIVITDDDVVSQDELFEIAEARDGANNI